MSTVERGLWDAVSPISGDVCREKPSSPRSVEKGATPAGNSIEPKVSVPPKDLPSMRQRSLSIIPALEARRDGGTHGPKGPGWDDTGRLWTFRETGFLRHLSAAESKDLNSIAHVSIFPRRSILFVEDQMPAGIHVLCAGLVKLSFNSRDGRTLISRIAKPGDVLDLAAIFSVSRHDITAETLRPSHIAFIRMADFEQFLAAHPGAYQIFVSQLCSHYAEASKWMRMIGFESKVSDKLSVFLQNWASSEPEPKARGYFILPLSHEEIAQCLGTSRESVSRAFRDLQGCRLLQRQRSAFVIRDFRAHQRSGCVRSGFGELSPQASLAENYAKSVRSVRSIS